jgi:hypothetical protein
MANSRPVRPGVVPQLPSEGLFFLPALTVLPFLRHPVGEYVVRPWAVIIIAAVLVYPAPAVISIWSELRGYKPPIPICST